MSSFFEVLMKTVNLVSVAFVSTPDVGTSCVSGYDDDASDQPDGSAVHKEGNDSPTAIRYAIRWYRLLEGTLLGSRLQVGQISLLLNSNPVRFCFFLLFVDQEMTLDVGFKAFRGTQSPFFSSCLSLSLLFH